MKTTAVALLLITGLPVAGAAQTRTLPDNAHVRVWTNSTEPVTGRVRAVDANSIVVHLDGFGTDVTIPRAQLTGVDIGHQRSRGACFAIGAATGAAVGFLAGLSMGDDFFSPAMIGGALAMFAAPVGGLIGVAVGPGDPTWKPFWRPAPTPLAKPAFALKFRF